MESGLSGSNDLWNVGERGPLGTLPQKMYAWVIEKGSHGEPAVAYKQKVVDVPKIKDDEVLVYVMTAGLNYNNVWAALGVPVSVFSFVKDDHFISGSDMAGIVWAVGKNVKNCKVGDEVVAHCNYTDKYEVECNGGDPMIAKSQKIWGYETSNGSLAQFAPVQCTQVLKKPEHMTWEESGGYLGELSTAYRMLLSYVPDVISPGKSVLVWGGAGGLGCYAIQLCKLAGAKVVAVVSSEERARFVRELGADGVIDRKEFDFPSDLPEFDHPQYKTYIRQLIKFKSKISKAIGDKDGVDIVLEHPGKDTFPISTYCAKPGGMIVFCAATTGYKISFDARFVWMSRKRIQGSHFASDKECYDANRLVLDGKIRPCVSETFDWKHLPEALMLIRKNLQKPGNLILNVGNNADVYDVNIEDISVTKSVEPVSE